MYPNNIYRMCQQQDEAQEHIMEKCQALHPNDILITTKEELFLKDFDQLQITLTKISRTIDLIRYCNNT